MFTFRNKADLTNCGECDFIELQNNFYEFLKNAKYIYSLISLMILQNDLPISIIHWYTIKH